MRPGSSRSLALLTLMVAVLLTLLPASALGWSSLVINKSAEDSDSALPGWTGTGFAPVHYGANASVPRSNGTSPDYPGQRLFYAGLDGATISQVVSIDHVAGEIDGARKRVWIGGLFGGPAGSASTVRLVAEFRDRHGLTLGTADVGGPDDTQRTGQTRLLECGHNVPVPPGARSMLVQLVAHGIGGFADELWVTTDDVVRSTAPGNLYEDTACFDPYIMTPMPLPPIGGAPGQPSPPPVVGAGLRRAKVRIESREPVARVAGRRVLVRPRARVICPRQAGSASRPCTVRVEVRHRRTRSLLARSTARVPAGGSAVPMAYFKPDAKRALLAGSPLPTTITISVDQHCRGLEPVRRHRATTLRLPAR